MISPALDSAPAHTRASTATPSARHRTTARGQHREPLARASEEAWARRISFLRQRRQAASVRQRIAAIDMVLNLLEERHLLGDRFFDRGIRRRVHCLEREVGIALPRRALRARNTVRLHAALLDWQETVLDALRPERSTFLDAHDSQWADPTPLGW
jgi:hypothetical protein